MSGHLCLKWNNHSSAFLKSFSKIQMKERYCDSTIICQGKYFPVHRIILSTCSAYFDEIFQTMQCQHPYIVFKDIEQKEMELLLNYMYQGEVTVVQEMLPSLLKAAEALRIKGLAEPDDIPSRKDSSGKKRSASASGDSNVQPKRRLERESDNSAHAEDTMQHPNTSQTQSSESVRNSVSFDDEHLKNEIKEIKQEPSDSILFNNGLSPFMDNTVRSGNSTTAFQSESVTSSEGASTHYLAQESTSNYLKEDKVFTTEEPFTEQCTTWNGLISSERVENLVPTGVSLDSMLERPRGLGKPEVRDWYRAGEPGSYFERNESVLPHTAVNIKGTSSKLIMCPFCDHKSRRRDNMKVHIMYKHTKERPFQCPVCPWRFTQKVDLKNHMRIHTGETPFECSNCSKTFRYRRTLRLHQCAENVLLRAPE